ncbi:MAG: M28 family peptidase [Pseudohongiellaceae bacterium]
MSSYPEIKDKLHSLALPIMGVLMAIAASIATAQPSAYIHHSLKVVLDPQRQYISVEDTITLPESVDPQNAEFSLNSNLRITANSGNLRAAGATDGSQFVGGNSSGGLTASASNYLLAVPPDLDRVVLSYEGGIYQQAVQSSAEYAQSFAETSGIISDRGIYLNAASLWVPDFSTDLLTFDLSVEFAGSASNWTAVSQGASSGSNVWLESSPMEEIYLVAANFTEYSIPSSDVVMQAYLRTPDANLATKYLDATERYLALYEPLLGEYPFSKFALVENFWETGYGMPSFTLLGEQIIRFPFIIDSSYPHEILHNWWGNGVYPDYESGNWSEGLTAYLADHLFQEMNGLASDYRRDNLIRYRNYVAQASDFPLRSFTSRNSAASQAVGYGKSLMLWHMLRLEVGDALFIEGLRQLYRDFRFQRAGFMDIEAVFSALTGRDFKPFFEQWVNRTGAPEFQITVEPVNNNSARIMFAQIQPDGPYTLSMPVALYYAGEPAPQLYNIPLSQKFEGVVAENFRNLQAVVVDPYFDVFRQLHREEIPPTIGQLFGAQEIVFVLPREDREQWRRLAEAFAEGVQAEIVGVEDIGYLPADRSAWILGRNNPFASLIRESVSAYQVEFTPEEIALGSSVVTFADRSTVLTARHPGNADLAIGWIHIDDMVALPGMIEKLPHYGKYSYLSFIGSEPTNDVKGNWTSPDSPMQWLAPGQPAGVQLAALPVVSPLAELPPKYLPEQLQRHVSQLTTMEMQGRRAGTEGAARAATYIADQFRAIGMQPAGGSFVHEWLQPMPDGHAITLRNVVGMIPGADPQLSSKPVVLAAHFDHLGMENSANGFRVFTGADDNASGVSIMLEVAAKLVRAFSPQRSILFVAFDGEESGLLGSSHFVQQPPSPYNTDDLFAMINLDGVGRLEGRSLQIFGADSAYEWPFMAQGIGFTIGVSSTMVQQVIASSDHVSFLNAGIPAIHVFSGVHADYHQATDTPGKLDYAGMSDVALWVEEAMVFLADRAAPLRVILNAGQVPVSGAVAGEREASLGSVPDFAYAGPGVRLSGVTPGGAAAQAGLQPNDVLLRYNDSDVTDLQTYSNLIRTSVPGDTVQLQILRAGQTLSVAVTLQAR